jgi:hypothetical protein
VYVATDSNLFGTMDTATGNFQQISGIGPSTSLAFGSGGQLYGLVDDAHQVINLYKINTTTGATTLIGDTGFHSQSDGIISYGLGSIPNGTLYTFRYGTAGVSNIYTINPSNGVPTLIGSAGVPLEGGIQGDSGAHLFVTQGQAGNGIYQINSANGHGTLLGNSNGGASDAIAFVNQTMYAFTLSGAIDAIDLTTGQSSQVASYNVASLGQIDGAAAPFAVPEPASAVLAIAGVLVLVGCSSIFVRPQVSRVDENKRS